MGASGWSYFVPYQDDILLALMELRRNVFQAGGYFTLFKTPEDKLAYAKAYLDRELQKDSDEVNYAQQYYQNTLQRIRSLGRSKSIDDEIELRLILNEPDGAHSILDIDGISEAPEYGKVSPCSESQLFEIFGTVMPDHNLVQENEFNLMNLGSRGQGIYVIVYKDGRPEEIFFTGISGD